MLSPLCEPIQSFDKYVFWTHLSQALLHILESTRDRQAFCPDGAYNLVGDRDNLK